MLNTASTWMQSSSAAMIWWWNRMYSGGLAIHDGDAGAHVAGIADAGAGFHPECSGLVAGGDAARGFRHHRCHAHRPAAQGGFKVLLDRREVGIAAYEQGCQRTLHGPSLIGFSTGPGRAASLFRFTLRSDVAGRERYVVIPNGVVLRRGMNIDTEVETLESDIR